MNRRNASTQTSAHATHNPHERSDHVHATGVTLLLDCGNTRIKWARFDGARLSRTRALDWTAASLPRVLAKLLATGRRPDRILVCSVAGPALKRALRAAARKAELPAPRWVRSERAAAGLVNGYREPWRLGVDRWVAAIGAIHLRADRPLLLVDIGTAMTLDLVDAQGRHRGGAIIPGPELMQRALLQHTVGIRRRAQGAQGGKGGKGAAVRANPALFAANTRAGLAGGALHACAGLIEHARSEARRLLGARCDVLVGGGAGPRVIRLLKGDVRHEPDLVMMGLAVLAFESLV